MRPRSVVTGVVAAASLTLAAHAGPALLSRAGLGQRLTPALMGLGAPSGVALTFDDGPHPSGTPAVLDALDALDVRATFFLVGRQVQRYPGWVSQILAQGHEVALHGHEHRNHLGRSARDLHRDLAAARRAVADDAGPDAALDVRFTRPPFGTVSGGTLWSARQQGLRPVLWTAWGKDWLAPEPPDVVATVLSGLAPGATVLLHDSDAFGTAGSWRSTASALPAVVAAVRQRELQLRRLSEHLGAGG